MLMHSSKFDDAGFQKEFLKNCTVEINQKKVYVPRVTIFYVFCITFLAQHWKLPCKYMVFSGECFPCPGYLSSQDGIV